MVGRAMLCVVAAVVHGCAMGFEVPLTHVRSKPRATPPSSDPAAEKGGRILQSAVSKSRTVDLGLTTSARRAGAYYVTLEVGNPPRQFRVHLDTGSSGLFLAAPYTRCPTCNPHFDRAFDESLSSTATTLSCHDPHCVLPSGDCGSTLCGFSAADLDLQMLLDDDTARDVQIAEFLGGDDTCSSYTPLPANACRSCPTCCNGRDACAFQTTYGDGSGVAGQIVHDEVGFGTRAGRLAAPAFFGQFDKVQGMDGGGLFEEAAIDGIFGVGGVLLNDGRTPVLDEIIQLNQLSNVFGLCLGGFAGGDSAMDIGEVDPRKYQGELMYIRLQHDDDGFGYYQVAAPRRTSIGGRDLQLLASDYASNGKVIIDSGASAFEVPTRVYNTLVDAIQSSASPSARRNGYVEDEPGHCFNAPVGWTPNQDYPTIRFWMMDTHGVEFALEWGPQHYFSLGIASEGTWCLGITESDAHHTGPPIFGDVWMEAFYAAFDREHFQLGLAPVAGTCGNHMQGTCTGSTCPWPIYGCTDPAFAEYDSAANAADPSACVTTLVKGCLSPNYEEYNPAANVDTTPTSCCTCTPGAYCPGLDSSCPHSCHGARLACLADAICEHALNRNDVYELLECSMDLNVACTEVLTACQESDSDSNSGGGSGSGYGYGPRPQPPQPPQTSSPTPHWYQPPPSPPPTPSSRRRSSYQAPPSPPTPSSRRRSSYNSYRAPPPPPTPSSRRRSSYSSYQEPPPPPTLSSRRRSSYSDSYSSSSTRRSYEQQQDDAHNSPLSLADRARIGWTFLVIVGVCCYCGKNLRRTGEHETSGLHRPIMPQPCADVHNQL